MPARGSRWGVRIQLDPVFVMAGTELDSDEDTEALGWPRVGVGLMEGLSDG